MGKLNVDFYDHGYFMQSVSELLETILGRAISELENPIRLIDEARGKVNALYANVNVPAPVADEYPHEFPFA